MDKKIALVIMLLVIAIQAIHFGYSYKYINYQNKIDDTAGTPRTQFNSKTTEGNYAIAFYIVAAGFSVLAYGACILSSMMNIYIHPKLKHHLNLLVFFFQFTLATVFAIEVSALVSPSSPNATATQTETNYKERYWLELADAIITWVICVPGSFALTFLGGQESSGSPVEQKSGTIS